ncbi:MAG TPA: F0F1 ATP synthase subunit epsilon [Candidatus Sumerlaeota bacterium]|nr:F0F1 ATP synthase subunit epsilon [Candidatus Sumerlaeota bacterium]HOR29093.1 F0F1 ATP synthase subunit epsilon [Candidatus Sumerlaeota bacterium]HPK01047.1 F0F1 ATP synthase subunit epsilon [Candidatus Sumerlaeota bacterium]
MADFQLQIYTQVRKVFEGRVESIIVPAETGYLGVLAHHAPLLATLGDGKLTVRDHMGERYYHVTGGFLEVRDNVATLLVDSLEDIAA